MIIFNFKSILSLSIYKQYFFFLDLMNNYLNKYPTPKRTHFLYLSRQDSQLSSQISTICLYNKYTFNSILSPNFDLFSIYLHFFLSPFKKNKELVSIFYETYCRHICFHYEMLEENVKVGVDQIIQQFFHGRKWEQNIWERKSIQEVTRKCLEEVFKEKKKFKEECTIYMQKRQKDKQFELQTKKKQNQYKKQQNVEVMNEDNNFLNEKHQKSNKKSVQQLQKFEKNKLRKYFWLQKKKQNIQNTLLIIKQNAQKFKQQQLFPFSSIQQSSLLPYITAIFKNLNNIHVLLHSQRTQMFIYMINRGLLINTPRPFKSLNGIIKQKIQIKQIFTLKKTIEKSPILTSLKSFLKRTKNRNEFINYEIAKDLIINMNNFRQDYFIFPQIQSKKITMDQKSLKLSYQQSHLILQSFGIIGKTYSPQLSIVFYPTPQPFSYQKPPFQYEKEYIQSRIDKYYMSYQQIRKEFMFKATFNKEIQMSKVQNSHVWRIISLIYLIYHTESQKIQHFSNRCYRRLYPQQNVSFTRFVEANQKTITKLRNGQLSLLQILDIKQKHQSLQKHQQKGFNFTMRELMNIFNIKDNESLQQTLQITKYFHEFKIRARLYNEIAFLLKQEKSGKKMVKKSPNINTYRTIYLLGILSFLYNYCLLIGGIKGRISSLKKLFLTPLKLSKAQLMRHFDNIFGFFQLIQNKIKSIRQPKREIQLKMIQTSKTIIPLIQKNKEVWQNLIIIYNTFQVQTNETKIPEQGQQSFQQKNNMQNTLLFEQLIKNIQFNELQSVNFYNKCCEQLLEHVGKQLQQVQKSLMVKLNKEQIQKKAIFILCNIFVALRKDNIDEYDQIYNKALYRKQYDQSQDKDEQTKNKRYLENLCMIEQRLKENKQLNKKLTPFTNKH